jgi:hypothetical protein
VNKILFIAGLCIALAAAALLFLNIIESGVAAMIGILGIGLIGTSLADRKSSGCNERVECYQRDWIIFL